MAGIDEAVIADEKFLTDSPPDFLTVCTDGETVSLITSFMCTWFLGPGEEVPVMNLQICLPAGTEPGAYELVLEDARAAIKEDLNAHTIRTVGSEIVVGSTVTAGTCPDPDGSNTPSDPQSSIRVALRGPVRVSPDSEDFTISVTIQSLTYPVLGFTVAIDYSEYLLSLAEVRQTLSVGELAPDVFDVIVGPETVTSMTNDPAEGYVVLTVDMPPEAVDAWIARERYTVAELTFRLKEVASGTTTLRLRTVGAAAEYRNQVRFLTADGEVTAETSRLTDLSVLFSDSEDIEIPIVPTTEDLDVTFRLSEAAGSPGDRQVPVYFYL